MWLTDRRIGKRQQHRKAAGHHVGCQLQPILPQREDGCQALFLTHCSTLHADQMLPAGTDNDLGDVLQLLHAVCRNADIQPYPEQFLRLLQILHHTAAGIDLGLQKERNIVGAVAGIALVAGLTVAFQGPHPGVDLLKSDFLIHMVNMLGHGDLKAVVHQ